MKTFTAKLTSEAVLKILKDVFFVDGEDRSNAVMVEGIVSGYGFHPDRLKAKEPEIRALLAELPDAFTKTDGASFLSAAEDKHGYLWGEHPEMEALFCLGIGVGAAHWVLPREMWGTLLGGMPFIQINHVKH